MYNLALLIFCISLSVSGLSQTVTAAQCSSTYFLCDPPGAAKTTLGPVGPAWDALYTDLVTTVGVEGKSSDNMPSVTTNGPVKKADEALCCMFSQDTACPILRLAGAATTECLLVEGFEIGVCWVCEKDTTPTSSMTDETCRTNLPPTYTFRMARMAT